MRYKISAKALLRAPLSSFRPLLGYFAYLLMLLLGLCMVLLGWNQAFQHTHRALRVFFLDVGQGDAAVIQTPSGKVFLLDTGRDYPERGEDMGELVVGPFLRWEGVNHIEAIILTHPHADHIGGAATLLRDFACDAVIDNGQEEGEHVDSPEVMAYLTTAWRLHVLREIAQVGEQIDCGDGVTLHVLAPTVEEREGTPNNASVVVRLDYGRTHFLFMGDAEAPEENELLRYPLPIACDVLKVGHHGSTTSSTPYFLQKAHPRIAVISVGAHNLYGHPSQLVIARLNALGATVYRTDHDGAIECQSNGQSVWATPLCQKR